MCCFLRIRGDAWRRKEGEHPVASLFPRLSSPSPSLPNSSPSHPKYLSFSPQLLSFPPSLPNSSPSLYPIPHLRRIPHSERLNILRTQSRRIWGVFNPRARQVPFLMPLDKARQRGIFETEPPRWYQLCGRCGLSSSLLLSSSRLSRR